MRETELRMGKYLGPRFGQDLRDIIIKPTEWAARHPVASKRAYDLINRLPTQPPDRQQRIANIVHRLLLRP